MEQEVGPLLRSRPEDWKRYDKETTVLQFCYFGYDSCQLPPAFLILVYEVCESKRNFQPWLQALHHHRDCPIYHPPRNSGYSNKRIECTFLLNINRFEAVRLRRGCFFFYGVFDSWFWDCGCLLCLPHGYHCFTCECSRIFF